MRVQLGRAVALTLVLALSGCDDDGSFSPTVDNVAGAYSATTFTLTVAVATVDQLVLGSEVELALAPDGTTTGHLFVPGAREGGADLDADLTGTWALSRGGVTFDQTADTFIRDVRFTADRNRLIGEATIGHQIVDLVLTKAE
jgi:hypothetical protein